MYKRVETEDEKMEFKCLYSSFIMEEEDGHYFEEKGTEQYLFFQKGSPIGTMEFQLLDSNNDSALMKIFNPLNNHALKRVGHQKIFIIGKLSLKKEYRGKGYFLKLLQIIHDHQLKNEIDWYTGMLNKPVYEMLSKKGFVIEKIGEEIQMGSIILVPFLLDIRQAEKVFLKVKNLKEKNQKQEIMT